MIALGIDPGLDGAAALLDSAGRVVIFDLPTKVAPGGGMVRRKLDGGRLVTMLREHRQGATMHAALEEVHTFPGKRNAPQTQGSLMHSVGVIECALDVVGIPWTPLGVHSWKRFYGLGADKNEARAIAARLIPDAAAWLTRVMDHNRAEALLMAHYLLRHQS